MTRPPGHLADHPLPPGIVGALGLGGYQLLVEIAGVGAGRLGPQVVPARRARARSGAPRRRAPRSRCTSRGCATRPRCRRSTQLAAQLGYLRLSGYRLALERHGLRSKIGVVNPATGAIVVQIPDKHPGRLFGGWRRAAAAGRRCARCRRPGRRRTSRIPSCCVRCSWRWRCATTTIGGAEAAELADRALHDRGRGRARSGCGARGGQTRGDRRRLVIRRLS